MKQTPHIALLPSPGMGHLIPMLEFAKKLIRHKPYISLTLIIPDSGLHPHEQKPFLESLPEGDINLIHLPQPELDDLRADQTAVIIFTIVRSLPSIRDAVGSLSAATNLVALVVDFLGTAVFDVARDFDVPAYMFVPFNATSLSVYIHLPELDSSTSGPYRDLPEPVQVPGCIPLQGKDLFEPFIDRDSFPYKWMLDQAMRFRMAAGIIVNTIEDFESGAIKALQENESYPPIYPVGPIVRSTDSGTANRAAGISDEHATVMKWLDEQPNGSVLFVSFGSLGSLSPAQFHELAFGLEMSEKRFIWVVRTSKNDGGGGYGGDISPLLPEGFLERIQGRGLVVQNWAPQARILSHVSTGGFLTHCGWNSVMESLMNGVPMIAWPLQADQKMNAALLSEELKIATRVVIPAGEEGSELMVERNEIADYVKDLMEGEEGKELRKRTKGFMEAAKVAVRGRGPSEKWLADLVCVWEGNKK